MSKLRFIHKMDEVMKQTKGHPVVDRAGIMNSGSLAPEEKF